VLSRIARSGPLFRPKGFRHVNGYPSSVTTFSFRKVESRPVVDDLDWVFGTHNLQPTSRGLVRRRPPWTTRPFAQNCRRPRRSTSGRPGPSSFGGRIGGQRAAVWGWSARGTGLPKREAEPTDVPMRPLWVYKGREASRRGRRNRSVSAWTGRRPKRPEGETGRAPCRRLPSDHDTIDHDTVHR
jgi:hypothetical protein